MLKEKTIENFWKRVVKTNQCWVWIGHKNTKGYGRFTVHSIKQCLAHRISYIISRGKIPKSLMCLHKCDNPSCVNPDHLFLGNAQDNVNDMRSKKRDQNGIRIGSSKLSPNDVKIIRESADTQVNIAKEWGINQVTVSRIKNRKIWKHI